MITERQMHDVTLAFLKYLGDGCDGSGWHDISEFTGYFIKMGDRELRDLFDAHPKDELFRIAEEAMRKALIDHVDGERKPLSVSRTGRSC